MRTTTINGPNILNMTKLHVSIDDYPTNGDDITPGQGAASSGKATTA